MYVIYRHSWANLNCLCWFPNLIVSIEKQKIFVHWVYKLVPSLQDSKNLYGTQDEFSHKKSESYGSRVLTKPYEIHNVPDVYY